MWLDRKILTFLGWIDDGSDWVALKLFGVKPKKGKQNGKVSR